MWGQPVGHDAGIENLELEAGVLGEYAGISDPRFVSLSVAVHNLRRTYQEDTVLSPNPTDVIFNHKVRGIMAESKRLRVESGERSAREYRIVDGRVEVRTLDPERETGIECNWRQVTSDQLSAHVERNSVVAQWLERRMGWRNLLRACVGEELLWNASEDQQSYDEHIVS